MIASDNFDYLMLLFYNFIFLRISSNSFETFSQSLAFLINFSVESDNIFILSDIFSASPAPSPEDSATYQLHLKYLLLILKFLVEYLLYFVT